MLGWGQFRDPSVPLISSPSTHFLRGGGRAVSVACYVTTAVVAFHNLLARPHLVVSSQTKPGPV